MNISIEPIKGFIEEKFLYNGDENKNELLDVEIIGVSTYVGSTITFHVLVDKAYLFSDIPIIALGHSKDMSESYGLKDLASIVCPVHEIENFTLDSLKNKHLSAFIKNKNSWVNGLYLTSFDFYTDNELLHLIKLDCGRFALIPNHKINWSGKYKLPSYKKNKQFFNI